MLQEAKTLIEKAWLDRRLIKKDNTKEAIKQIIELLNEGDIRVAEPTCTGEWLVNEWIKKAVILYFSIQETSIINLAPFQYNDKIPVKTGYDNVGARIVPPSVVRYGAYIDKGVVLMPSFVNIGAHIETGSLIDSWVSVGTCAQIGKNVHISSAVSVGGVLEPPQAIPVVIDNGCFIGSNCVINEGIFIGEEAIIAAGVILTQSTKIIDVTNKEPIELSSKIPQRAIVIQGSYTKSYASGDYQLPCALIVGYRKKSDELKASLKEALNEYNITV